MARVGRRLVVRGRVQGVFFRAWTQQQAIELGIVGWVRNRADGSVEAHLSGELAAVEQLIARLRQGPPSALVSQVDIDEVSPGEGYGFEVRH